MSSSWFAIEALNLPKFLDAALVILIIICLQLLLTVIDLPNEGRRRIQHATTGQVLILVSYYLPIAFCQTALLIGIVLLFYVFHYQRKWYLQSFGALLRPAESSILPGAFWFLVGTWLTSLFADLSIGRYAVLCLSYADPMASWVGSSISSPRLFGTNKTIAGCCACFVTAIILWLIIFRFSRSIPEIFVGALACTCAEIIPVGNDNLLIPIFTAFVLESYQQIVL
jgi:dolichol kinase